MSHYQCTRLRCEYKSNPLGIDIQNPRLSWEGKSSRTGAAQSAYELLVASSPEELKAGLGGLWKTGKVNSSQSIHIPYEGKELKSNQTVFWMVRIYDQDGKVSSWSKAQTWSMGFLDSSDWKGEWIRHTLSLTNRSPLLRSEFPVRKKLKRAHLYASAKGIYHIRVNGKEVTEDVFAPGWSEFKKRIRYRCYDITRHLKKKNAIGVELGDGWYRGFLAFERKANHYGNSVEFLGNIILEYEDGTHDRVHSDGSWKTTFGPTQSADFYMGEDVDAQLTPKGWTLPGFNDSQWESVATGAVDFSKVIMQSYPAEPVERTEEICAQSMWKIAPGKYIFDFGQNFAGRVRIQVPGKGGAVLRMRFAEIINHDKTLYTDNLRSAKSTDIYVMQGKKREVWEPKFTFHGFRYAEISGLPTKPELDSVTGIVLGSNTTRAGDFECSNQMINQVYKNSVWTQRANFLEVPTDCPQRDERLGWTGDAQVYIRSAICNMDTAAFFTKWMDDVNDAQHPDGAFTNVAPDILNSHGDAAWGDAGVVCPWTLYQCYEDLDLLKKCYPNMKKWIQYLLKTSSEHIRKGPPFSFGDWLSLQANTPKTVIQTAHFAFATDVVVKAAKALKKSSDVKKYTALHENIRSAFRKEFVTKSGIIMGDTQTAYILALHFRLLDERQTKKAVSFLVKRIRDRDTHISTGFVGTAYIMQVLRDHGQLDIAYQLLENKTYPGWGFSVMNDATTIWERWNGWTKDGGPGPVNMNSYSHYAYGAVTEWLFDTVAGIDRGEIGFQNFRLKPRPGGSLKYAKATHHSPYGLISSHWKKRGKSFDYSVEVPANTTAEVELPTSKSQNIRLNGHSLESCEVINGVSLFTLPSGIHEMSWS
jgi:alpha-L-rhamnosidase